MIPSCGGLSATLLAGDLSPLKKLQEHEYKNTNKFEGNRRVLGDTPESNVKLKFNALQGISLQDQITRDRELAEANGTAQLSPAPWDIEIEAKEVEPKALPEPKTEITPERYTGNPFTGQAAIDYENRKKNT